MEPSRKSTIGKNPKKKSIMGKDLRKASIIAENTTEENKSSIMEKDLSNEIIKENLDNRSKKDITLLQQEQEAPIEEPKRPIDIIIELSNKSLEELDQLYTLKQQNKNSVKHDLDHISIALTLKLTEELRNRACCLMNVKDSRKYQPIREIGYNNNNKDIIFIFYNSPNKESRKLELCTLKEDTLTFKDSNDDLIKINDISKKVNNGKTQVLNRVLGTIFADIIDTWSAKATANGRLDGKIERTPLYCRSLEDVVFEYMNTKHDRRISDITINRANAKDNSGSIFFKILYQIHDSPNDKDNVSAKMIPMVLEQQQDGKLYFSEMPTDEESKDLEPAIKKEPQKTIIAIPSGIKDPASYLALIKADWNQEAEKNRQRLKDIEEKKQKITAISSLKETKPTQASGMGNI